MPAPEEDTRSIKEWRGEIVDSIMSAAELMTKVIIFELRNAIKRQGIATKLAMLLEAKKLQQETTPYIGAVLMLNFIGKPVIKENIEVILEGVGMKPEKQFMDFVLSMNFENNAVSYAVFIYLLKLARMEISAENLAQVARDVELVPNEIAIRHVMDLYRESEADGTKIGSVKIAGFEREMLESGRDAAVVTGKLLISELDRTLSRKGVDEYVKRGFMYYVISAGTLSMSGMVTLLYDKRTGTIYGYDRFLRYIANLVKTAGLQPEQEILEYIKSFNYGYSGGYHAVPVIYYLKSIGKEPSIGNVVKLLDAVSLPTEDALIGYILKVYNDYQLAKTEKE